MALSATPSSSHLHTEAADETTATFNSRHSTSAPTVHSGNSRNKSDTLSANFLYLCITGPPNFDRTRARLVLTRNTVTEIVK